MDPQWLKWAKQLQAIAQNGLAYSKDPYDIERYNSVRAIALRIVTAHSDLVHERVWGLFAGEGGYATPKVDVRGVLFRSRSILLVRERTDGKWTLPGGWADVSESASEAVVREVLEESGLRTQAVKLLAVYDRDKHNHPPFPFSVYKLFFRCEIIAGKPTKTLETKGVGFFPENGIPELSLVRVTRAQIARMFEHLRHPDWLTDFD